MVNVLTDVPWIFTDQGPLTVRETLVRATEIQLDTNVPGFVYGAQLRFLMTLVPLIYTKSGMSRRPFIEEVIDEVIQGLSAKSQLFDEEDAFLQFPFKQWNGAGLTAPVKLAPGAIENQAEFWGGTGTIDGLSLEENVRSLVVAYFYMPGVPTKINDLKLTNGSSALRYQESIEIVPLGESLADTLLMITPKSFLKGSVIPYWARRQDGGRDSSVWSDDPLWGFSWWQNSLVCQWERDENGNPTGVLEGIVRGGQPRDWWSTYPDKIEYDKGYGKLFHDLRSANDPLYHYRLDVKSGEKKMVRFSMRSDPYGAIARWHAEHVSNELANKWANNIRYSPSRLQNLLFLEHATEGASNSFSIRFSKVIVGYRDELLPANPPKDLDLLFGRVLEARRGFLGMFTDNGTMSHIKSRRADAEDAFWDEFRDFMSVLVSRSVTEKELLQELKSSAIRALDRVSSRKNTATLQAHLKAINNISRWS